VNAPQNRTAYFHQSRFHNNPAVIEIAKNAATNAPIISIVLELSALTELASVGMATSRLDFNPSSAKGTSIGRTKVISRMMISMERSLRMFAHPYPWIRTTTATSSRTTATPYRIVEAEASVGASGSAVPLVGSAGAAVSVGERVSSWRLTYPTPRPMPASSAATASRMMKIL
jgi:hypothetical protein